MAVKTITVSLSQLNNPSLGQFLSSSLEKLRENAVNKGEDQIINTLLGRIEEKLPQFLNSLTFKKQIFVYKDLKKADITRDQDLSALLNYLKSLRHTRQLNKQEALRHLEAKLKPFRSITKLPYEKESAQLKLLLSILDSPESQAQLKLLQAEEYVANLRQSQLDFYKLFMASTKQVQKPLNQDQISALRRELAQDYQKLYNYLDILLYLEPATPYRNMMTSLNEIRYHYNLLQVRSGKRDKKTELALEASLNQADPS